MNMKAKMMYAFGLLSVFVLFACSDEENESPIVAVESISISPSSISLERDKTYQLQAEVTPKEATEKRYYGVLRTHKWQLYQKMDW